MFKKALVAAALLSAMSMNVAHAADGTITFKGNIIAATCEVNGAAPGNIDVTLGDYSTSEVGVTGTTLGSTQFDMALTGCPTGVDEVTMLFDGTADSTNGDVLKVTAATGVGIGIYETDGAKILINTPSKPITLTSGDGTASFVAKYVSTGDTVGAGDAGAVAQYTIQYR